MARTTIKDVARAAGVSVATVSRALSGARGVLPEHKELVIRTAEELGYRPHSVAQALRRARTGAIGMVVPRIDNPFFPQLVGEAERLLQGYGLSLLLCSCDDDVAIEAARLQVLVDRQVDGLLVSACSQELSGPALAEAAARVPTIQLDQRVPSVATPFVGIDDASGMQQILDLLRTAGRTRPAYIGAADENWSGLRRRQGFQRWAGTLDPTAADRTELGSFTREFGHQAGLRMLRADPTIDAVVCGNDLIAIGVLDAAAELGRRVPEDLQVTGFDDINVATVVSPALTTVRQPVPLMVRTAVDLLLSAIDGTPQAGNPQIELPVDVIERNSTLTTYSLPDRTPLRSHP